MADFKFNFNTELEDHVEVTDEYFVDKDASSSKGKQSSNTFQEVFVDSESQKAIHVPKRNTVSTEVHKIHHLSSVDVEEQLVNQGVESAVVFSTKQHSDVIPNVYEGGLKVWECCYDLIHFLSRESIEFQGMKVLEIGCGAGLPGIFALLQGAAAVHFQDFNQEVLQYLTIPNVLLNATKDLSKCRFFAGDWDDVAFHLAEDHFTYDVMLMSETIYNPCNYHKLLNLCKTKLAPRGKMSATNDTPFDLSENLALIGWDTPRRYNGPRSQKNVISKDSC